MISKAWSIISYTQFTKWVGEAWKELVTDKAGMRRSFEATGLTLPIDGSDDEQIKFQGWKGEIPEL